jgi:microcystin-dependent protein
MADPYIAEIRIFAGNFAPRGWAFCDGQLLQIAQNTALFSLIGTTYGGDGRTTTGLPNLQGRLPMHWGRGPGLTPRKLGERGGFTTVTLNEQAMPAHDHAAQASSSTAGFNSPGDKVLAQGSGRSAAFYAASGAAADMNANALLATGGGQAHNNLAPYQVFSFIIALQGLYPSRS